MKETILITGGLGFIGTNLTELLVHQDKYNLRVLDNNTNPSGSDIFEKNSIEVLHGDIRDKKAVEEAISGCDSVVHLAAHTRVIDSIEDPSLNFDININGTFNILEAMRKHKVNTLINASTGGAIIGDVPPPVDEEMTPKPSSPYGASKLFAEGYCSAYSESYGINCVSLRFSNIYGAHSKNKSSVVAAFIKDIVNTGEVTVYGDGTQTRDYLYVADLAIGIKAAIENNVKGVFQLGSGIGTNLNELIDIIKAVIDRDFDVNYEEFRQGEILHTYCNINKAKQAFGFSPKTKLKHGIENTYSWFKESNLA